MNITAKALQNQHFPYHMLYGKNCHHLLSGNSRRLTKLICPLKHDICKGMKYCSISINILLKHALHKHHKFLFKTFPSRSYLDRDLKSHSYVELFEVDVHFLIFYHHQQQQLPCLEYLLSVFKCFIRQ